MPFELSERLVVGVASSALFDLGESDAVFRERGVEAFRAYQRAHLDAPFAPGVAFPLVKRLLGLNAVRPEDPPVEVVLLSRNDAETGRRAFRSIEHYGLPIQRAAFLKGGAPDAYIPAFSCELFLSANEADIRAAVAAGQPAGHVTQGAAVFDEPDDHELRVAFDFDGVLADDQSERVYQESGVEAFRAHEARLLNEPHVPGPLQPFLARLAAIQKLEAAREGYAPRLKTAIVTARGAPAHERVVETLGHWGVEVDQAFFLGGVEKTEVLKTLKPHVFFDDQRAHLDRASAWVPAVHVPFGVANACRR